MLQDCSARSCCSCPCPGTDWRRRSLPSLSMDTSNQINKKKSIFGRSRSSAVKKITLTTTESQIQNDSMLLKMIRRTGREREVRGRRPPLFGIRIARLDIFGDLRTLEEIDRYPRILPPCSVHSTVVRVKSRAIR